MPKLPTFNAQVGNASLGAGMGGRRADASDLNDPGLIAAGRQIRSTGESLLSHMEETEARQALVESTEIRARYAKALDEAALSGADLTKLREQMDAELAKIGEKFSTTKGASSLALYQANAGREYDQQANQIAVVRAATRARSEGQKLVNALAAEIDRDPSTLPRQEEKVAEFLRLFPGISPETRTKLQDDWNNDLNFKAAVRAMRDAPEAALKRLEDGHWNVKPEQREVLIGRAQQAINLREAAEDRRIRLEEKARDEAANKARDGYTQRILSGDLSRKLEKEILMDPVFEQRPQYREHMIQLMRADAKRLAGQERQGSKQVERDLWLQYAEGKLFSEDHIHAAVKANAEGKPGLDLHQARTLLAEVGRLRDSNYQPIAARAGRLMREFGEAASRNVMIQGLAAADPNLIPQIQMEYRNEVDARMEALRKQDKDPRLVFDPTSKEYVGPGPFTQEIFDRVLKAKTRETVDAAKSAGAVDLRREPDGWKKLKPGDVAIMPDGTTGRVTAATIDILKRQGPAAVAFPVVPSGETPDKQAQREAAERAARYRQANPLIGDGR